MFVLVSFEQISNQTTFLFRRVVFLWTKNADRIDIYDLEEGVLTAF